jgi:hypothetical protein
MRKLTLLLAAAALSLAGTAEAATLITDGSGHLTGVTDLVVGGPSYDVQFVDGTCAGLFNGCNDPGDFAFHFQPDANSAATALYVTAITGIFDTTPSMINGCTGDLCIILIPYGFDSTNFLATGIVNNAVLGDSFQGYDLAPNWETASSNPNFTYAVFAPHVATGVPEPGTWAMMLIGFGAIGAAMRRRKRELGTA